MRNAITDHSTDYSPLIRLAVDYSLSNVRIQIQAEITCLQSITSIEQAEIRKIQAAYNPLLKHLADAGFAKQETIDELPGKCLWVPASITRTAQERDHRLVYGGVSIAPNLCIIHPGNPLFEPIMEQSVNTANQQWVSITTLAAQARSAASTTPASSGASGARASAAGGGRRGGGGSSSGGGGGGDDDDFFPGNSKPPKGPKKFKVKVRKIEGFQDHHIISDKNKLTNDHPVLKLAGFDLDDRANKIYLPEHEDLHSTRSIHIGKHLGDVMKEVKEKMDDILRMGQSKKWTPQQYHSALIEMVKVFRFELKKGNIKLNKNHRLWSENKPN